MEEREMRHMKSAMTAGAIAIATLFLLSAFGGMASTLVTGELYAGQNTDVGSVTVTDDATNIYVTFDVDVSGWYITETHVDIQTGSHSFPVTKSGNPQVGKFAYSSEHDVGDVVTNVQYTIPKTDVPGWDEGFDVAAHAVVAYVGTMTIDFEDYSEKDEVSTISTDCGDVGFYMTSATGLSDLEVGDYSALTPIADAYPVVAEPDTHTSTSDYPDIVGFTVGAPVSGVYVDDKVTSDPWATGAGGMVLTDPQDTSQTPLMWHAYHMYQAIVIDLSSVSNLQGLSFAAIDLDHNEYWRFLYFDADGYVINEIVMTGAANPGGDGRAYPIEYEDSDIAKVVMFGWNNNANSGVVGYAFDNFELTCIEDMETAWGSGTGFSGNNWATYMTYSP
jgi:hypothetical protein